MSYILGQDLNYKIFALLIIAYLGSYNISVGQGSSFENPFFKETGFFASTWEKQNFSSLNSKEKASALHYFTSFEKGFNEFRFNEFQSIILEEVKYWATHKIKNPKRFLRKIFEVVHLRHLKKYRRYPVISQLFENKIYDCVTGTALFAMIFDGLGFQYTIYETANHCYLIVQLGEEKVLFESTDPLNGFIDDSISISATQMKYASEMSSDFKPLLGMVSNLRNENKTLQAYSESIDLYQLAGLYYYNQAIVDYNLRNYFACVRTLEKSLTLYPSKRVLSLLLVAIQETLKSSNIDKTQRKRFIAKTKYYTALHPEFFD